MSHGISEVTLKILGQGQQKELYDNPARIVSNADFRKLFGQRSLKPKEKAEWSVLDAKGLQRIHLSRSKMKRATAHPVRVMDWPFVQVVSGKMMQKDWRLITGCCCNWSMLVACCWFYIYPCIFCCFISKASRNLNSHCCGPLMSRHKYRTVTVRLFGQNAPSQSKQQVARCLKLCLKFEAQSFPMSSPQRSKIVCGWWRATASKRMANVYPGTLFRGFGCCIFPKSACCMASPKWF